MWESFPILQSLSHRFDKPQCLSIIAASKTSISVQGAKGNQIALYAGGLDSQLRDDILLRVNQLGIKTEIDLSPSRRGIAKTNICNRGSSGILMSVVFSYAVKNV